jgi:C-terminal processing protease CtpA/Prc
MLTSTNLLKKILFVSLAATVVACGGGGGGSSSPPVATTPPPATGFDAGQFQPSSQFKNLCATPRPGTSDRSGTTADENNWLRSWSNELYLWYDEIRDQNPRNFTTAAYFDVLKTEQLSGSGRPKDRFHFTYTTEEWNRLSNSGIAAGYGAKLVILASSPPREIVVAYVTPGTAAANAGLVRGTRIVSVDDVDVATGTNVTVLNSGLFPSAAGQPHRFQVRDPGTNGVRGITMTSADITMDPVDIVSTISNNGELVGYIHFNDHNRPSEAKLVNAFRTLRDRRINDLVLDLRYNGGGFLDIANETAYMIAGAAAQGRTFEALQFNRKHTTTNPVTGERLEPDRFHETTQGFSATAGQALPTLGLSRVFVLTTARTCSASESIINGLRGIGLEVVQIGGNTCGKPYGFYPTDNCGTTYFTIQFQGVNAAGFGDYTDGFGRNNGAVTLPGCSASDDFSRPLGDPAERLLGAALAYQDTGSCPVGLQAAAEDEEGIAFRREAVPEGMELVEPFFPGAIH